MQQSLLKMQAHNPKRLAKFYLKVILSESRQHCKASHQCKKRLARGSCSPEMAPEVDDAG
jgi:hypothetical protein